MKIKKNDLFSFALTAFVISADQVSKFLAVTYMEPYSVFRSFFGDFLILRLVYNTGAAFSIGAGLGSNFNFRHGNLQSLMMGNAPRE